MNSPQWFETITNRKQAMRFDGNLADVCAWIGGDNGERFLARPPDALGIKTLEGWMWAARGDWIIKGLRGEFYSCKPDVFEKSYRQVTGD